MFNQLFNNRLSILFKKQFDSFLLFTLIYCLYLIKYHQVHQLCIPYLTIFGFYLDAYMPLQILQINNLERIFGALLLARTLNKKNEMNE